MDQQRGLPSVDDTGGADGEDGLAVLFSEFARSVQQQRQDPQQTMVEIVRAAVDLVPGCDEGSISVVLGRSRVRSEAASGELPRVVDELQERLGGPCMDAAYAHETVRVSDMATEQRWPAFTRAAIEVGAVGMLAIQLFVEGDDLGALNLFSRTAGAFTDESEHVDLLFASHAAVAYAGAAQQARLQQSVATRQLIGQAQGILMERHRLTDDQAFAVLVRASQHGNTKLRDVAGRLVRSGHLDGPP